jgi:dipeptidyl aminopeptidase/acylaminoacyl peptidase
MARSQATRPVLAILIIPSVETLNSTLRARAGSDGFSRGERSSWPRHEFEWEKHVQLIATGEMQTVPQPESLKANAAWSIASWFPDSTRCLANAIVSDGNTSMWAVSVLGHAPRKIREDATAWSVSPDGSHIAFSTVPGLFGAREIWLMTSQGEQARKLFAVTDENSGFTRVAWSPDSKRVAYLKFHQARDKFEVSIETRDLIGGSSTVLLSNPLLHDFYWLSDGHVVYSIGQGRARGLRRRKWSTSKADKLQPVGGPSRYPYWGSCRTASSADKLGWI